MTAEMFDLPCLADSDPEDRDDGSLTDQLLEALRVAARAATTKEEKLSCRRSSTKSVT